MSYLAISVEDLGKQYKIAARRPGPYSLRENLMEMLAAPFRRLQRHSLTNEDGTETIWAVRHLSFAVEQGDVLGIIGRNGAGKSTLLKILSRITEPTEGYAEVRGRVGSLLEVGTGFHPELTGRQNIYFSGAILGMKKAEIERKFDEIVAFAEVEKFIDTPIKHYSSGMYVRLAFAVAAHLQAEILLVDEVLAVGDLEFQKKCIGTMERNAKAGKTALVVSHSMSTLKALCSKAILLEEGLVKVVGSVDIVVANYLKGNKVDPAERIISDEEHLTGVNKLRVRRIRLINGVMDSFSVYWLQPISISLDIEVFERLEDVAFGAGIRTIDGTHIFTVQHDDDRAHQLWKFERGDYIINFTLQNDLRPGLYKLHIGADHGHIPLRNICALDAVTLEVLDHSEEGLIPYKSNTGLMNGKSKWAFPTRST